LWLVPMLVLQTGCGQWFGSEDPPLPGDRITVIAHSRELTPDPELAGRPLSLPLPQSNPEWPQAAGYANHAMHHLRLDDQPQQQWTADIGSGAKSSRPRLARPIFAAGRVFAMDSDHQVSAIDPQNGATLWRVDVTPDDEADLITGGLGYDGGRLFVTGGFAEVIALNADDGSEVWRKTVEGPIHSSPAAGEGRVFAITVGNVLYAFNADDGGIQWIHRGIPEAAAIVGGGSPALDGGVVIAPFSSGELVALRADNGRLLWGDLLAAVRRTDDFAGLSHIRGAPVIDRGRVFAVSTADIMASLDIRTGQRQWDVQIGGLDTPWVAGDYLYVVTDGQELVCLSRGGGRLHWVTQLPRFENEQKRKDPIVWTAPVLVSDRLIVASSSGEALSISPYDGRLLGRIKLPGGASVAPIVANDALFLLTDEAKLLAFR
jgi:outer membrane protein assembly factor BamB